MKYFKQMTSLLMMCCIATHIMTFNLWAAPASSGWQTGWWTTPQTYGDDTLDGLNGYINNTYLSRSTVKVAQDAETNNDLAKCFEEEMLTNPVEGEEVDEKNINRSCMQLLRAMLHDDQPSLDKLKVIRFTKNKTVDLENKKNALIEEQQNGLLLNKIWYGGHMCLGALSVITGACSNDAKVKVPGVVGGLFCIGKGAYGLYYVANNEEAYQKHIDRIQKMKNGWEKM